VLKILYASCLGLFPAISAQFTFEMHVTARNHNWITPFMGAALFFFLICGDPFHPAAWNFVTK